MDSKKTAPLFVIIAASLWGVDGVVLRPALYSLPVPLVVFIESGIVALLISPFVIGKYRHQLKEITKKEWLIFLGIAVFGGAVGTMAITKALFYVNYINLSIVILIQKLQPVFALLLAAIFLREKLPRIFFLWAAIAVIGAYLMTFGMSLPNFDSGKETLEAALFALIAAVSFAASTVMSKRGLKNVGFQMATYLRFFLTTIIMLGIILAGNDISSFNEVSTSQLLIFLIIAFTTGGAAIFLYYYGLRRITASVSTICELAFPLTAVVLEFILRDNILGPIQWLGVAMLIFSILRVTNISANLRKLRENIRKRHQSR